MTLVALTVFTRLRTLLFHKSAHNNNQAVITWAEQWNKRCQNHQLITDLVITVLTDKTKLCVLRCITEGHTFETLPRNAMKNVYI